MSNFVNKEARRTAWTGRYVIKGVFVLVLLTAVVLATCTDVRVRRRVQVVAWKVSGSLPYVGWSELFRALLPSRLTSSGPPPGYFIREKAHGAEPCSVLWETPKGDFWGQEDDNVTLQDPGHLERYESGPVTIRSGDVVIDVGSQIGTFTRRALGEGASRVIAIEPDPTDNICFKRTFQEEIAEGRVVLVEAALWENSGMTKFVVTSRSDAGEVASEFGHKWKAVRVVDVPTITLDALVQKLNLTRVDFIKWAIGRATRHALQGARQTLARSRPRMVTIMVIDPPSDDPVVLPRLAREAVPTYHVFTYGLGYAYFY
jgi:FkbM family methyltransferase